jgi:hypothetical protein
MVWMRKGADSYGRPMGGHASRGVRHPRRRDAVWLVTGVAPNLALGNQAHHTSGSLALDSSANNAVTGTESRRCMLVVEHDPALAEALTRALQTNFEPTWPVRRVSDNRLLSSASPSDMPEIIVLDASNSTDTPGDANQRLTALYEPPNGQLIFVTTDTSYQLSQRGAMSGVVLREWRHLDDIIALVAEALMDDEVGA